MPQKAGATKCERYRTISLMSHLTKLIIRVLLKRIRGRTADEVAEEQYGFMPDKGTRNAIFLLRILAVKSIQMQKNVYICFLDYVKENTVLGTRYYFTLSLSFYLFQCCIS